MVCAFVKDDGHRCMEAVSDQGPDRFLCCLNRGQRPALRARVGILPRGTHVDLASPQRLDEGQHQDGRQAASGVASHDVHSLSNTRIEYNAMRMILPRRSTHIEEATVDGPGAPDCQRHRIDAVGKIGADRDKRILDLGCGDGRHVVLLAEKGYALLPRLLVV